MEGDVVWLLGDNLGDALLELLGGLVGPALVGIEQKNREDYEALLARMKKYKVDFIPLQENPMLFNFLI